MATPPADRPPSPPAGTPPRSALSYRRLPAASPPDGSVAVALQRYEGSPEDLVPLARGLSPSSELLLVEAPRGLYAGRALMSTYWYVATDHTRPDGPSFGDALYHLEQLLLDLSADGEQRRFLLLGEEQGAVLALALLTVRPELLLGVVALEGSLPEVAGWEPGDRSLEALPVLLADGDGVPALRVDETAGRLTSAGARVTRVNRSEVTPRILEKWHAIR